MEQQIVSSCCPGAASYNRGTGKYPGIGRKIPGYFSAPRFYDVTSPGYWQIPGYFPSNTRVFDSLSNTRVNDSGNNVRFVQAYIRCVKLNRFQYFVCLFNRSLRTETHLGPDGTRLKQNAQAKLKSLYKHAGQLVCGNVKGVYRVAPSATWIWLLGLLEGGKWGGARVRL